MLGVRRAASCTFQARSRSGVTSWSGRDAVLGPLARGCGHLGTATRAIDAERRVRPALALDHGMAIRVERHPTAENDGDGPLDAAVGEGEGYMGFLGKGLDCGWNCGCWRRLEGSAMLCMIISYGL